MALTSFAGRSLGMVAVAQHQSFVHSHNWFSRPGHRGRRIDPDPSLKTLTAMAG